MINCDTIYSMGVYHNCTPKPVVEVSMDTKICTRCKKEKSLDNFYSNVWQKDKKDCWCKQCKKETGEIYRKNNRVVILIRSKAYRDKHREYIQNYRKLYAKSKNIQIGQAKARFKREVLLKSRINDLTLDQWEEIKKNQNYKCAYCGKEIQLTIDHIVPISKGGNHTQENIQGLCKSCNCKKQNKIDSRGFELILNYFKPKEVK